ncbi:Nicotinamide riboside kinase [Zancudomyces culisetae]|uniref:Nicotinamide riboside kinase n=1 Tax=Zancudomyces culisetae TaxID=1213189 RepID=A0A1R1PJH2_ZANCU|nr:Nicotinamide riboside kinase [Zancudomyces culisetae]|eukprot:OMH81116.1 Nicotinamide riboside kinase [Zancudomyces culisetae]
MKTIVIGISGPSCSGKTTLSIMLKKLLGNCSILSQDSYYKDEMHIPIDRETGLKDYDTLGSFETEEMVNDILKFTKGQDELNDKDQLASMWAIDSKQIEMELSTREYGYLKADAEKMCKELISRYGPHRYLVVEGICVFQKEIMDVFDTRLFLECEFEMLKSRRKERECEMVKAGSDKFDERFFLQEPPQYFESVVWRNYTEYLKSCKLNTSEGEINFINVSRKQVLDLVRCALDIIFGELVQNSNS